MGGEERKPVEVSRRIAASAADIFAILADPTTHVGLDGSGMLRGAVTRQRITARGDVFVMKMYFEQYGDYEMDNHVIEFEFDRRIGWEPVAGRGHPDVNSPSARWGHRWSFHLAPEGADATMVTEVYDCSHLPEEETASIEDGRRWIETMTETLLRLERLCARPTHSAVTLRDVVEDDIQAFYRHQSDTAAAQMAQVTQRDEAAYLAHWTRLLADETVGKMTVLFNGAVAGQVISFNRDGVRELGYWLGREYWGQGVAGAAVQQYLALERHRPLFAVVTEHNEASRRILLRCGFKEIAKKGDAVQFELSGGPVTTHPRSGAAATTPSPGRAG